MRRSCEHRRRKPAAAGRPTSFPRALMASSYRPAMLHISHHERVEGHPHRWHVFLHGRDQPIPVERGPEERRSLELTDEEIHDRLPTALERHHTENRDDLRMVPGEQYNEASWDSPVRLLQNLRLTRATPWGREELAAARQAALTQCRVAWNWSPSPQMVSVALPGEAVA